MNNKIITTFVKDMAIIIFAMFPLLASAQIEPLCPNCKKTISKCPYKGKHPKVVVCSTCKKLVSKCPFKGKHPHQELIEKKIVVDGMTYNIKGKEATLIKGKIAESIMIPQYVSESGRRYPVVAIYKAFFEKGFGDSLKSIKSISIPYGVKSISHRAFQGCHSINSLYIPASVEIIENEPFFDCYGLKTIIVDSRNTHFDSRENCNAIIEKATNTLIKGCDNTIVPSGIKIIGKDAFIGCTFKTFHLPEGIEVIGSGAFDFCENLQKITFPSTLKEIRWGAFFGCRNLDNISLPNSLKKIADAAFYRTGLIKVLIPSSVEEMSSSPFGSCNRLKEIVVDKNNKCFDSREDCNAIIDKRKSELIVGCRNTKIPKGIKKLGDSAFSGCSELSSISIPESVLEIGRQTFHSCKKLKVVSLPSSTQKIGVYAFQNSGLETLKIPVGVDIPSDAVPKTANVIKF